MPRVNPPRSGADFPVDVLILRIGCEVTRSAVSQWRDRGLTPPVDLPTRFAPIWWASTIADWCAETGRVWNWDAAYLAFLDAAQRRAVEPQLPQAQWPSKRINRGGRDLNDEPPTLEEWAASPSGRRLLDLEAAQA